ncbi:hypothetical protein [Vibrio sp. Vb0877]|uniref:hypothetical protein n=1 Tax=Vibrio sp. Vb0877 TaxID=2816073 RepID=UPI001F5C6506|nr:hypothetical protein [Vibrio sp. Vb0877]
MTNFVVSFLLKALIRQALSRLFDIVIPNKTNLVELTMTPPNQTQYHLELILAIYNLIPYNKKVTARQIQAQTFPAWFRALLAYYPT